MIKVEHIDSWGFEHTIRGMRNPLNSWDRSDSYAGEPDAYENCRNCTLGEFTIGENDLTLMRKLYVGGAATQKVSETDFRCDGYYSTSVLVERV